VRAGSAGFQTAGGVYTITNSPGTIINWQGFSIGVGEVTRFQQQSVASAVLNRVVGGDPSSILGTLSSNGSVFLINPHGVIFGRNAVIDTAAFVASTLDMRDEDFLAGRFRFEGGGEGVLRNEGTVQARGDIFLVGPSIENAGLIQSETGSVLLAAGRSVTISSPDAHGVQFALQAPTDNVLNLGAIAASNAVGLFAGTLRHSGDIRATSASAGPGGRIVLAAQQDAIVDGTAIISADSTSGRGGSLRVTGERVGIFDTATLSARGATGGGEILVGGDLHGANPEVRNAWRTFIAAGALLDASATVTGDGGKTIVWSDDATLVHGTVLARGGPQGGAGGFVETSGRRFLDVAGLRVDAKGTTPGTWLLDPYNIEVVAGAGTVNNDGATTFAPSGDDSQVGTDLLVAQLNAGTSVVLSTGGAASPGTQAGNITINAPIVKTASNSASLTLSAHNDIAVNANITLTPLPPAAGDNSTATLTAGHDVAITGATVQAANIIVTAGGAIIRSGAQANDFVFGRDFPSTGVLNLVANGGAIGSLAQPIRFKNARDIYGRGWSANTVAAGAGGHVYLQPTNDLASIDSSLNIQTDPATTQTVSVNHTGTTGYEVLSNISGNDDWTINTGGYFRSCDFGGCSGGHFTLTGHSFNVTAVGDLGASGPYGPHALFDTAASNGNIVLTAASFDGTGCGGGNYGVGVKPGSGSVTATSTGLNCGGSIQLVHYGGDLLTSKYNLNFTGGSAEADVRLKAANGHLILDSTAGFNVAPDKNWELRTLTAGKDIRFAGGTIMGNVTEFYSAGSIDNLAPGTDGFVQANAAGSARWRLVANGGIGATNPVEGKANWTGSAVTAGSGAAGNIRLKFTGGNPRFGEIRTDAATVQDIDIQSSGLLFFQSAQPGLTGALGGGATFATANDSYTVNAAGNIWFDNFDNSFTASTITMTSGGSFLHGVSGGGDMMSTTGLLKLYANGGSIGSASNYARLTGSGPRQLYARDDIYIDAGANPLTLAGLTTAAGAGTIGLRTTAANDLTFGGVTDIDDALNISIGGNIVFPAGSSFTTSGGLTLNSPTQIAATAAVSVTGGTLSASAAVDNTGTLTKGNAGTSSFSAGLANSGAINVNAGTLDLTGGYTDAGGVLSLGGGNLTSPAAGLTLVSGTLKGAGTVDGNVVNNGTVAPGTSPGTLVINGNYTQGAGGILDIELGGTAQGVTYDLLQVTGIASLDGTLSVSLFGGFAPVAGNSFDVVTYASRSGNFASSAFPAGYGMTGSPNPGLYNLAVLSAPAPPPSPAPGFSSELALSALEPSQEVLILQGRFIDAADPDTIALVDEEKKGAVLECN
jgi:filamentous hemagglutinin family protein